MTFFPSRVFALFVVGALSAVAPADTLAPTPPMGWNSWDCYGSSVREAEVKANADFMAEKLKQHGWQYIIVDIEWYQPNAKAHGYIPRGAVTMDDYGRFVPSPNRFPSAANGQGFKPLADYVHAKGLKFGIHIMRGIPREAVDRNLPIAGSKYHAAEVADKGNVAKWKDMEDTYGIDMAKPGAQAYYDSIAALYAQWGVDYVKADDMSSPYQAAEIHALSQALKKSGRPIVLSLSPGPAPLTRHQDLRANAQLWRISNDFWDRWSDVKKQFDLTHAWEQYVQPGGWPDADMLPLGHIGIRAERGDDRPSLLSHDEQITLMSLWSIFRSPLMFGGDLPTSDQFTMDMLTNAEVLAVNQSSTNGHQSYRQGGIIVWTADKPGSSDKYLAIINESETAKTLDLKWATLGIQSAPTRLHDLWTHTDKQAGASMPVSLKPHASVFYEVGAK